MTGSPDIERQLRAQLTQEFLHLDADPDLPERLTTSMARARRRRSAAVNTAVVLSTAAAIGGWWLWSADGGHQAPDVSRDPTSSAALSDCSGVTVSATGGNRLDFVVLLTNGEADSTCDLSDLRLTVSPDGQPTVHASSTADPQDFDGPDAHLLPPESDTAVTAVLGPGSCAGVLSLMLELDDGTTLDGEVALTGPACTPELTALNIASVASAGGTFPESPDPTAG